MQASATHITDEGLDINKLYIDHAPFVGRILLRFLGDGPQVDDLLQETFIVAFEKRASFDPTRAAPSTWLYGIASNLCKRDNRSRGRRGRLQKKLAQEPEELAAAPDAALSQAQDKAVVQRAIQELPFKMREVFVLFEIESISGKEIATMLSIPIGTVHSRLHEARGLFRKRLARTHSRAEDGQ